jgi:hypothetical protein
MVGVGPGGVVMAPEPPQHYLVFDVVEEAGQVVGQDLVEAQRMSE